MRAVAPKRIGASRRVSALPLRAALVAGVFGAANATSAEEEMLAPPRRVRDWGLVSLRRARDRGARPRGPHGQRLGPRTGVRQGRRPVRS